MPNPNTELLSFYNELVDSAIKSNTDFPERLCEFLIKEAELEAAVFFRYGEENVIVMGRSARAKKEFEKEAKFTCKSCQIITSDPVKFDIHTNCSVAASDKNIPEGSLVVKSGSEKYLLKLAKNVPFSKTDIDEIVKIGLIVKNLISLWSSGTGREQISLSELITEISQELKTPTNSIMGFASLLNEQNLTPSQSEYVSTLKESAFNLLSLINDLIDLAKLERNKFKSAVTNVNIKNIIDDITKLFSSATPKSNVEFLINIDSKVPDSVKVDSQKLRYILINLITFSLRLMEKGRISISVSQPDKNKIDFKISDTSPGLTSAKIKDIFNPFILKDLKANNVGNISGIGLILTKRYIDSLNGTINITSTVGKGITYTFNIEAEPAEPEQSPIEEKIAALPKPEKKSNVLVVEDDYATSKLLSNYLNKWGYKPVILNSGEQAIKAVEKENYMAILMDIMLPDMNGFELLQQLRENKHTRHTPVIICSVEAEQQKAFLMGAVEYFVKPINYNYLVEVLTSFRLKKDSTVLVVDDDVPTLNLIKGAVEQLGFTALAESHSSKVPGMIDKTNVDLAIIDLDMPEITGFDLIKEIKSKPKYNKLPIIIYTGKENYKEDLKKIDGLFEELLDKNSSNIEDLADTVNAMIERYEVPASPEEIISKSDVIKILLVEDYKHSQIIVTRLLKKNSYDSIVVVENGLEALEEVKKQRYDLILMDMQMHVMNGFEATEKIRMIPDYRETPIIALTAFAMKGDREKCLEAGATDYIPKPIDSQEFIEKVKFYTEQKKAPAR